MSIDSNFDGFKKLVENAKDLEDKQSVPLTTLLNDSFIQDKTPFLSLTELFEKSGFKVESQEDFKAIPDEAIDKFISENSEYETFQEMLGAAAVEYTKTLLFKGLGK